MGSSSTTSSPGSTKAITVSKMASVAPLVTTTSRLGVDALAVEALRVRGDGAAQGRSAPEETAYWFTPPSMAARAAALITSGPSKSGKPWPRLTAPCSSGEAGELGEDGGAEGGDATALVGTCGAPSRQLGSTKRATMTLRPT